MSFGPGPNTLYASLSLASGSFSGGGNSENVNGLRMTAEVKGVPGQDGNQLEALIIYGMKLSTMNKLSVTGKQLGGVSQKNTVTVQAATGGQNPTTVFEGVVLQAYIDANDQPNVRFIVTGWPGADMARKPVPPVTRQGAAQAQDLASQIAKKMGFQFENNGVKTTLQNPYLWGTSISQMRQLSKAAFFEWIIDRGTLAIWPKGKSRSGSTTVSKQTGMIGYPVFSDQRLIVRQYFNGSAKPGAQITVQSDLTAANGTWNIDQMHTSLDAYTPHGRWESTYTCSNPGNVPAAGEQG